MKKTTQSSGGVPAPKLKIEMREAASLIPCARNAREHSDTQVSQVARSIREWGWTVPILIDEEDSILAGHCRLMAAQKLGLHQVPVIVARGWSQAQKQAYVIADNKLTLNSSWDGNLLVSELRALKDSDFDVALTGMSSAELDKYLGAEKRVDDRFLLLIECSDETQRDELKLELGVKGYGVRAK